MGEAMDKKVKIKMKKNFIFKCKGMLTSVINMMLFFKTTVLGLPNSASGKFDRPMYGN